MFMFSNEANYINILVSELELICIFYFLVEDIDLSGACCFAN